MLLKFCHVATILFLAGSLSACSGPWVRQQTEGFWGGVDTSFQYGTIDGFLQIPRGGKPGTTSNQRPKLDEVGINTVAMGDASLSAGWGDHGLYGGAHIVRPSGEDVLDKNLISHGTTFPAGSRVELHTQLDTYRFGYQYHLLFANSKSVTFSLTPGAGVTIFNFDYNLESPGNLSAKRAFSKAAPQLKLDSEWRPIKPLSVAASASSSLPFSNLPYVLALQLTVGYQVWGRPDRGAVTFLGIGYDRIDFEDNQQVPNHIVVNMGPLLIVGLKGRF